MNEAVDQSYVTLTCVTLTTGVTGYKFFKDKKPLSTNGNTNTYIIAQAPLKSDNGNYTCIAYFENVPSEESQNFSLIGELC